MLKTSITTTVNGSSVIKTTEAGKETEVQAAVLYGTIDSAGRINVTTNIHDEGIYKSNRDEIMSDIKEFEDMVYSMPDKKESTAT